MSLLKTAKERGIRGILVGTLVIAITVALLGLGYNQAVENQGYAIDELDSVNRGLIAKNHALEQCHREFRDNTLLLNYAEGIFPNSTSGSEWRYWAFVLNECLQSVERFGF